jgi:hypothetical protein
MKIVKVLLALLPGLCLTLALGQSAFAGLKVVGAKIDAEVTPGNVAVYDIQVVDNSDAPMDIVIEVKGYGLSADGIIQVLEPDEDDNPYSAREYLSLSLDSFHLEPGESQGITVNAAIPDDVGDGGRYAVIFIRTVPGGGSFSVITAVAVPVRLTIKDSKLSIDSEVTEVGLGEITSQEPLKLAVELTNNGNCHYKPQIEANIKAQGKVVATCPPVNNNSSLIPGCTRKFKLDVVADAPLPADTYEIDIVVRDEAGKPVTSRNCALNLENVWQPPEQEPALPAEEQTLTSELSAPVEEASPSAPAVTPQTTNWLLIWSIAGGVVFLGLLTYFYFYFKFRRD